MNSNAKFFVIALLVTALACFSCGSKATGAGDEGDEIVVAFLADNHGEIAPCG